MGNTKNSCQKFDTNESGFTLVELMITIGIVGILSAVAIPNYQKYITRSRQVEVKTSLSALFTAEMSYSVEAGAFSGCLTGIGFVAKGAQRYYNLGFANLGGGGNGNGGVGFGGTSSCNRSGVVRVCGCDHENFSGSSFPTAPVLGSGLYSWAATAVANRNPSSITVTGLLSGTGLSTRSSWMYSKTPGLIFRAAAIGSISSTNRTADEWYIDQTANLVNNVSGK